MLTFAHRGLHLSQRQGGVEGTDKFIQGHHIDQALLLFGRLLFPSPFSFPVSPLAARLVKVLLQ